LLLVVWRLHHVGRNDQQAASRHRRLSSPAGPVRQPPQPQDAPDAARAATRPPKAAAETRCRGQSVGSCSSNHSNQPYRTPLSPTGC
jgi:hypothetical protein